MINGQSVRNNHNFGISLTLNVKIKDPQIFNDLDRHLKNFLLKISNLTILDPQV